jgi:CPA2 family monovalent cation:H+ antiporter-2
MQHETELIGTVAMGLSAAFVIGLISVQLRVPPIVGYLIAGVIVGPFTPGYVADASLASQLAELGVILLMFGVGLHFSLHDLLEVKRVAVPGALIRIVIGSLLGLLVARIWGWSNGAGLVFGLGLSVASTVVLLRALIDYGALGDITGKIAIGWLIVEDLVTVMALVLLPVLASSMGGLSPHESGNGVAETVAISLAKVGFFLLVMIVVGRRLLPWIFERVVGIDSRELFILAVLALALGVSYGASRFFDVSFALGAFVAGLVLSETDFGHQAAEELYTIREAFGVLFFVSVGMLIDPAFLLHHPGQILIVTLIIVIAKTIVAFIVTRLLGQPRSSALTVAIGLGQIGEFSFILATMAVSLQILPKIGSDLILAGALTSITINALIFRYLSRIQVWLNGRPARVPITLSEPG